MFVRSLIQRVQFWGKCMMVLLHGCAPPQEKQEIGYRLYPGMWKDILRRNTLYAEKKLSRSWKIT